MKEARTSPCYQHILFVRFEFFVMFVALCRFLSVVRRVKCHSEWRRGEVSVDSGWCSRLVGRSVVDKVEDRDDDTGLGREKWHVDSKKTLARRDL